MKKLWIRCLALLLLTLLLPTLPACSGGSGAATRLMLLDEETRAYALYDELAETILDAAAFSVTSTTTFSGRADGQGVDITYTVRQISRDQNGKGRMDYCESAYVTQTGGVHGETYEYRTVSGYADGYLFRSTDDGGYKTTAKTAVPYDEYAYEYARISEQLVLSPEIWDCKSVSCLKNEDGSFTATFSGLNYSGLDELSYDYGLDLSMISSSIYLTDATVTVHSTSDLLFKNVVMELTYSEYDYEGYPTDREYVVTTEQVYEYAIPDTFAGVDLSAFADIGDLTALDDYLLFFDERVYADRGTYTYTSRETVTEDGEASVWHYDVKMELDTYGNGFNYSSEGTYGYEGELYDSRCSYENGVITFRETDPTGETYAESYEYTEDDVRYIIYAELALSDFSSGYVVRIEELDAEKGAYRFHLGAGLEREYKAYFADMNGSMRSFEAYLDVTLRDGELLDYELYLVAEGFTETAESYCYQIEVSCTFEEKITSATPV